MSYPINKSRYLYLIRSCADESGGNDYDKKNNRDNNCCNIYGGIFRRIPSRRFNAMDNNNNPGCPYHPGQHGKYAGSA